MSMYWGDFTCFTATTYFVANNVDFVRNAILLGLITVLHMRGGGRGQPNLLQYYMKGGSAETPKLYYVIYEQPLIVLLA